MNNNYQGIEQILELHDKFVQAEINRWLTVEVFTLQWWILVCFATFPWILWIKLCQKQRLLETALVGALSYIITAIVDGIGFEFKLWYYPTELVPFLGLHFSFDLSMVPVGFMIIYQYFEKQKTYFVALVIMALVYAFIGEPLSHQLQLVQYVKWKYIYSFFYYIITGMTIKIIVDKLKVWSTKKEGEGTAN